MRENRTYGSEGGEGKPFPTPISTPQPSRDCETVPPARRRGYWITRWSLPPT
jgi:hypothetical protein